MTICSVKQCGARRSKNQPTLTFHRFPVNEILKRKWLDIIGIENINPNPKTKFVCSLHFEEACFNRTLDVVRLRDDAVPSLLPQTTSRHVMPSNTELSSQYPHVPIPDKNCTSIIQDRINLDITTTAIQDQAGPSWSLLHEQNAQQTERIKNLTQKCVKLNTTIKNLKQKIRRRDKKIAVFSNIIQELKNKNLINHEESILIQDCAGPKDFLKRQISKSKGVPLENKYSEELRKFAFTLHFLSPKAYNFVRKTYNTCLPHVRTFCKWYQHINAEPGFTKEAFDVLKLKVTESNHPILCALTLDEMAIRKGLTWDPKGKKFFGRVNCGQTYDNDFAEVASQSLVFMLTCINGSWKIPIGYFLINSLHGEQKTNLVQTALQLCGDAGVKVASLTCDGLLNNFSMLASLGCDVLHNQQVTSFENSEHLVHVFIDPCHAIKLIRNAFGEMRVFKDHLGREIDFKYLELLLKLQEEKGLHLANKIGKAHIHYEKQKMKVKLATQLLSSSVTDALEFSCNTLKIEDFKDCDGTVNFINIMNNIFDVLNSHAIRSAGWKKAMCPENIGLIRALFDYAIEYIKTLTLRNGELLLVVNSRRKTGFIALITDMNSALSLYEHLVENTKMLKYVPLYKISQDHIELFFSAIRARGGFNNNPNAVQFRAAYKKLLIRAEIRDEGVGNCIPLEQINILTCSSSNPVTAINELSQSSVFREIPEDESDLYETYLEYFCGIDQRDEYSQSILEYIAGFVTRKLSQQIKCEECLTLLNGEEKIDSLIYKKSHGGLKYASTETTEIIKKTENLIKPNLGKKKPENYYMYIFRFLTEFYETANILCLPDNAEHNATHRVLLIKSIIKLYIDIRFRYYAKTDKVSFRSFYNKMVLFRNE